MKPITSFCPGTTTFFSPPTRKVSSSISMCGILGIFQSSLPEDLLRKELIACSSRLRHRGPDWSGYKVVNNHGIAHERLAIMDPESGEQPLVTPDGRVTLAVNGEIYNYKEIYKGLNIAYDPMTGSDCEAIIPLFLEHGCSTELPDKLRGMFSFILYDKEEDTFLVVRDHMGITPLYIGWGDDGSIYFSSEMKGIKDKCMRLQQFPPGHMFCNKGEKVRSMYTTPVFLRFLALKQNDVSIFHFRNSG